MQVLLNLNLFSFIILHSITLCINIIEMIHRHNFFKFLPTVYVNLVKTKVDSLLNIQCH